eukprot:gene26938-30448_t
MLRDCYEEENNSDWVPMQSRSQGRLYFLHTVTNESVWEKPDDFYLRVQINVWASDFFNEHGREPFPEDIPEGTDISRMYRDYRMLKQDAEVDKLEMEQAELRKELNPDSRERLREIKERLTELEDPVNAACWTWIKEFTQEHGRAPTENDMKASAEPKIKEMFKEYTQYRDDEKKATLRQGRSSEMKDKAKMDADDQKPLPPPPPPG